MKNPEKIKIEIESTETGERDVKKVELAKMLYSAWLVDKSEGILSLTALIVCDVLLTKEERGELEKQFLGRTFEDAEKEIFKK